MASYCENDTECRRRIQLNHFGEQFDRANCKRMCDNCKSTGVVAEKDVSNDARSFLNLINQGTSYKQFSLSHWVKVWRGSKAGKVKKEKHDELKEFGNGKKLDLALCERISAKLLSGGYLSEKVISTDFGAFTTVGIAPKAKQVMDGGTFTIAMRAASSAKNPLKPSLFSNNNKTSKNKDEDLDQQLRNLLQDKRATIARQETITPYHVLTNGAITEMVVKKPKTLDELRHIPTVTAYKVKKYGVDFVALIRDFCSRHYHDCAPLSEDEISQMKQQVGKTTPKVKRTRTDAIDDSEAAQASTSKYFEPSDQQQEFEDLLSGWDDDEMAIVDQLEEEEERKAKVAKTSAEQHSPHSSRVFDDDVEALME